MAMKKNVHAINEKIAMLIFSSSRKSEIIQILIYASYLNLKKKNLILGIYSS